MDLTAVKTLWLEMLPLARKTDFYYSAKDKNEVKRCGIYG
jgi:hypothetical protein